MPALPTRPAPAAVFVVSHSHWDREWYETFQQFRLKLVDLIDQVLELLDHTPGYQYFTLDGQAIVLEDYLAIRPEREQDLRRLVQGGRLLVGPWYVLPDEFLVSPEALIRNLQRGMQVSRRFGEPMAIGYIPDPFGHISQMPQILRGFGITEAVLSRGLGDEPVELRWQAPDGSSVFLIYLRESYGNFAWVPRRADRFVEAIAQAIQAYLDGATTPNALLLNGTDHLFPQPELPELLAATREALPGLTIHHATLPQYIAAVRATLPNDGDRLPVVAGELRSPRRFHLLPGVLSTRIWIKQANDAAERLLERYAEPLTAWATLLGGRDRSAQLGEAWRLLMENHPHDSICGCSIDQVHEQMQPRFAGVMEIGNVLVEEALGQLAGAVHVPSPQPLAAAGGRSGVAWQIAPWPPAERAITVFNPALTATTGRVEVEVRLPGPPERVEVVSDDGAVLPALWLERPETFTGERTVDGDQFRRLLQAARAGHFFFRRIRNLRLEVEGNTARIDFLLHDDERAPDLTSIRDTLDRIEAEAPLATITQGRVRMYSMATGRLAFVAASVPGHGYRTFRLRPSTTAEPSGADTSDAAPGARIENEFFRVEADPETGTFVLEEKRTGRVFRGLGRLVDGGDAGDQYSYSPPAADTRISDPATPVSVEVDRTVLEQTLTLRYRLVVPAGLAPRREARASTSVPLDVVAVARLVPSVARLDLGIDVLNQAEDHRLRIHFPLPGANRSWAESHFDVISRPTVPPRPQPGWVEDPPAFFPQRGWTAIENDAGEGLAVAVRGLPEVETTPDENGDLAIKLTLLRCVGDLSRSDLRTRRGHAGPTFATPGAQCPGAHHFELSLIPYADGWQAALPLVEAFRAGLRAASRLPGNGFLPSDARLLRVEPVGGGGIPLLSAVKRPQDCAPGLIVRLWNPASHPQRIRVEPLFPIVAASRSNLREQPADPLPVENNAVTLDLAARQILTLHFDLAAPSDG